jgi:hypothetical protein
MKGALKDYLFAKEREKYLKRVYEKKVIYKLLQNLKLEDK